MQPSQRQNLTVLERDPPGSNIAFDECDSLPTKVTVITWETNPNLDQNRSRYNVYPNQLPCIWCLQCIMTPLCGSQECPKKGAPLISTKAKYRHMYTYFAGSPSTCAWCGTSFGASFNGPHTEYPYPGAAASPTPSKTTESDTQIFDPGVPQQRTTAARSAGPGSLPSTEENGLKYEGCRRGWGAWSVGNQGSFSSSLTISCLGTPELEFNSGVIQKNASSCPSNQLLEVVLQSSIVIFRW